MFTKLVEEEFYGGQSIMRQGDAGDKFFVIIEGEAAVVQTVDGAEHLRTHLYQVWRSDA